MMQMNWNVMGLCKKSKASVAQRDDMKRLRSEDDEKHKDHTDHDSKHDKMVASLLAQLDGVDSKLHVERIIASSRGTQFAHCVLPERCPRWNADTLETSEICDVDGTFSFSFNEVVAVHDGLVMCCTHVLDRNVYVSDLEHPACVNRLFHSSLRVCWTVAFVAWLKPLEVWFCSPSA